MAFNGITAVQARQFQEDGYLFIEALFEPQEVALLLATAKADRAIEQNAQDIRDGEGGRSKLTLWYKTGDDLYSMFIRCQRVAGTMERLLGHPICHFHSKMMLKEPFTGGAWSWHQDYGYWHNEGYMLPDEMASCLIAADRAMKENGCLQVLKGSHRMGRVEHGLAGDQTGADPEWVAQAMKRFELVYCEMAPGTALFFHSNLLHRSDANRSPHSRWSLICCYTTERNLPFKDRDHPGFEPLQKVPDTAIRSTGMKAFAGDSAFMKMDDLAEYNERLRVKQSG